MSPAKQLLEQQLWKIADTLRGKMDADDFRDYILGFIFYKYLSERMHLYADKVLKPDGITYYDIDEDSKAGKEYLEAVKEEALEELGYFLKPSELFGALAARGNAKGKSKFILDDLTRILNNIEQSTLGTASEDDFSNLFEDLDLTSSKLGKTEEQKNELIVRVMFHLDQIDFDLDNPKHDVLGDAYEYLIGKFASGAGKKAGEFYTPQQVSTILARLVTVGKKKLKSVYDPTCGSGSLLLRVAREVEGVGAFYGQESNPTTYNLARMNMIMHDVHYRKFDIKNDDTLERPQHLDMRFEAIVANPPFSAVWSASPLFMSDDRFSAYGRLAPKGAADFAFIQHMIHQLDENGTMATVMPHGVLFRGGAEGHIRQYLVKEKNYLDAVIGLPANIFYGTEISTCILVFKKKREHYGNVLVIDASQHFEKIKTQNYLRDSDIKKIIAAYKTRKDEDKYAHVASLKEIEENEYNLNISRYVDSFEEEQEIDLAVVSKRLGMHEDQLKENDKVLQQYCSELNLPILQGSNLPLLSQYKKGVMRQIFSRRTRFKDEKGKEFPQWKYLNGNEIFESVTNKNHQSSLPILAITQDQGAVPRELINYKISVTDKSIETYKVVEVGDFIISLRSFQGGIEYSDYKGICSPAYIILRPTRIVNNRFYKYYFKTEHYIKLLNKNLEGIRDGKMISYKYFSQIKLPLPATEEQNRIVDFLSAIDTRIELVSKQIEKT